VAALQLLPANASRVLRLEALAHVVTSIPFKKDSPEVTASRLRQFCDSHALNQLTFAEDPAENMFTEEFTYFGGSYMVMPGIVGEGVFILENLCKAIFLSRKQNFPPEFRKRVHDLVSAALCISDFVLRTAGLRRGAAPVSNLGGGIDVPGTATLRSLQSAVTLPKKKVIELLRARGLTLVSISSLTCTAGSVNISQYQIGLGSLLWNPLVDFGDHLVLAVPGMLVSAVRHAILLLAIEAGVQHDIAASYNKSIWDSVVKSLQHIRNELLPLDLPPTTGIDHIAEGFFSLDRDKLLYCLLATDSLAGFKTADPFHPWTDDKLSNYLSERVATIESFSFSSSSPPNELLILVLLQGFGGAGGVATIPPPLGSECVLMSAEHLRALCLLEGGDPLVLFNFARAQAKAQKRTPVTSTSILDEFQLYRHNEYSYYVSDKKRPDFIVIPPGDGLGIRTEIAQQRDFHAAEWFGSTVQVTNLHSSVSVPLYVPVTSGGKKIAILVEGYSLPVWVTGPETFDSQLHGILAEFVNAAAFWLWQIQPSLKRLVVAFRDKAKVLHVHLELMEQQLWTSLHASHEKNADGHVIEIAVDQPKCRIHLSLYPDFVALLNSADNSGERELMRKILAGLSELLSAFDNETLDPGQIEKILDTHAPLGIKKMILMTNTRALPQLDPRGLPRYRRLQGVRINEVLDEIGEYLVFKKNLPIGKIDSSHWTGILNDVAKCCFDRLAAEFSILDPAGLLEFLIAQSESVIRETTLDRLNLATRIECFGSVTPVSQQLIKKIPELSHVSLASRFLVEYAASKPPTGYRPISMDVNDRLRALAYHLINFAMLSDAVHFKLQDYQLSILPSERLGISGGAWVDAMQNYMKASAQESISAAPRRLRQHWEPLERSTKPDSFREDLNIATEKEFGHSLEEILGVFDVAAELGIKSSPTATRILRDQFIGHICARLKWLPSKAELVVDLLSLTPRSSFWKAPPGYEKQDLYPWRYNRLISYLRRPFIVSEGDSVEILWGNRHVREARTYLIDQIVSGKLRPRSKELRSLNSKLRHEEGEAFNSAVADFFKGLPSVATKSRVTKIAKSSELETHLGDIDVLIGDKANRRVLVIECKNFALARTPYEMAQEVNDLFVGRNGKKSAIEKHLNRAKWIKSNLDAAVSFLKMPAGPAWRVVPMIIVDEILMAPYLKSSPIQVSTFDELKRKWPRI
jgi:hypothetical protein